MTTQMEVTTATDNSPPEGLNEYEDVGKSRTFGLETARAQTDKKTYY
jgi:hypothetical protein